jgi:hypothetical protein
MLCPGVSLCGLVLPDVSRRAPASGQRHLKALGDFLVSLDTERPLLLVRRLEVERGEGPRADLFLRARVEIGQAWRPSGGPV